jgi:hypothetical protein
MHLLSALLITTLMSLSSAFWAFPHFQLDDMDKDGYTLIIKFRCNPVGNLVLDIALVYA